MWRQGKVLLMISRLARWTWLETGEANVGNFPRILSDLLAMTTAGTETHDKKYLATLRFTMHCTLHCIITDKQRTRNAAGRTFTHSKPVVVYVYYNITLTTNTKLNCLASTSKIFLRLVGHFLRNFLVLFILIMGWFLFGFGKKNDRNVNF